MWLGKALFLQNTFYKSQIQSRRTPLSSVKKTCQVILRDNGLVSRAMAVLPCLLGHDSYTMANVLVVSTSPGEGKEEKAFQVSSVQGPS